MVNWDSEFKAADEKVDNETKKQKNALTIAFALTVLMTNAVKDREMTNEEKSEMIGSEMLGMVNSMGYDLVPRENAIQG